jgi:hypothetical protein
MSGARASSRDLPLVLVLALALLCLGIGACGSSTKDGHSATGATATSGRPLGDEDRDNGDKPSYLDGDDASVSNFGHAAGASEARAIAALLRRYYAAAAEGSGAKACPLLYYIVAESLPEEYGRPPGPLYLSGADSCQAVLSRVFARFHAQLAQAPTVKAVRVEGDQAQALLAWSKLPAGSIELRREGSVWKLNMPLALALP